ncbi:PREDICTED: peroxidase 64-like, partial [Nelumbo nucifera]|uniref:Peroxidase 64-like n=1 Tax=Nelumbo nucifera TaxID=4432 RepID=A0A1U7ZAK3_NELNU
LNPHHSRNFREPTSVAKFCHGDGLKKHFYKKSCPQAEDIIGKVVWKNVAQDATVPAGCCDGLVLLNSTKDHSAERDTKPNLTLDSFEVVDEAKDAVEKACPGVFLVMFNLRFIQICIALMYEFFLQIGILLCC